jgi:hypothetical protein
MSETPEKKIGINVKPTTTEDQPDEGVSTPAPDSSADNGAETTPVKPVEPEASAVQPAAAPAPAVKAPEKPSHRAQAAPVLKVAATSASTPSPRPATVAYAGSDATSLGEVVIDGVAAAVAIAFFVIILQQFLG